MLKMYNTGAAALSSMLRLSTLDVAYTGIQDAGLRSFEVAQEMDDMKWNSFAKLELLLHAHNAHTHTHIAMSCIVLDDTLAFSALKPHSLLNARFLSALYRRKIPRSQ
jgi:hypothetical protein